MTRIDVSAPVEDTVNVDAAAPTRERARIGNVAAVVALSAGLVLSAIGALSWHDYVQGEARNAFVTNASGLSTAVSTSLRRDVDFVAAQRSGIVAVPDITNHELAVWYRSIDITNRYPGGVGFGFVQRVLPSQLGTFGAQVIADPPVNEPVSAPYTVFPAGLRSQYCLQRFGIATSQAARVIPTNFDFCNSTIPPGSNPSPIPRLLDEATNSGQTTVLAAGKIAKTGGIADLFVVFSPVYTAAGTPASIPTRRASIRGWIIATFSGNAILVPDLASDGRLAVRVLFAEPGTGRTTIASSGRVPSGPRFTRTFRFNASGSWIVQVVGSAHSTATAQAIGVGILGGGVCSLLFLLFLLLMRSRTMALRLVDRRTRQLRHLALHDPLTDLPNRALILDRAEQMLLRARRHPLLVGALFIDLDEFKEINDTFGHDVGDQVLKAVGRRLSGALRASDSVGRLGGDEFVVLVEGELGGVGPEVVASQLLAAFVEPFSLESGDAGPFHISASIGVAIGPRSGAADLLRDADVALYVAKAKGKNCYVVFGAQTRSVLSDELGLGRDRGPGATRERSGRPS